MEISHICRITFAQFIFLPSTIHITMILPLVATNRITANISDQKSFCHHGRSNGRSWLTKIQSKSASRRTLGRVDLFNASSKKWRNSLRLTFKSTVILSSRIHALQLYIRSRVMLFMFVRVVIDYYVNSMSWRTLLYHSVLKLPSKLQ